MDTLFHAKIGFLEQACGCERTSKEDLVAKSIIKKVVEDATAPADQSAPEATLASVSNYNEEKSARKVSTPMEAPTSCAASTPMLAAARVEEYSRPGSAYVKRDSGSLPPPPPSRAGRALSHGQSTRRVREGRGALGTVNTSERRMMNTDERGGTMVDSKDKQLKQEFNMMTLA